MAENLILLQNNLFPPFFPGVENGNLLGIVTGGGKENVFPAIPHGAPIFERKDDRALVVNMMLKAVNNLLHA